MSTNVYNLAGNHDKNTTLKMRLHQSFLSLSQILAESLLLSEIAHIRPFLCPPLLKVIYHPLYSMNKFVTNKAKWP